MYDLTVMSNKDNQYCVILAGGVGRRFWPYSNKKHPKQFLDFFESGESLLQMSYRRFRSYFSADHIFVVTNRDYHEIVREQVPELSGSNILLEPSHRNTAAAIAYGTMHVHAIDPDSTIVVAPSDHLVSDEALFVSCIAAALEHAEYGCDIITLGIKPAYPETGYGYIQAIDPEHPERELEHGRFYPVKTFTEKPNKYMSKVLVDSGEFFWNSGLFIASGACYLREFRTYMPELCERLYANPEVWGTEGEQEYINEQFPYCPNISFDYGVMEKADNVKMLLCDFGWADLGTWNSIYTLAPKDDDNNASVGCAKKVYHDSERNLVVTDNPNSIVVLQGLNDILVVQKGDILLICPRGDQDKLKQILPEVQQFDQKNE